MAANNKHYTFNSESNRRHFIGNITKLVGTSIILYTPLLSAASNFVKVDGSFTVKQIMDAFIKQIPGAPFPNTVDTLKAGNGDIVVTGIVTTMFATIDIIRKAIDLGANFIIAHEPTFYNHADNTAWLTNDDVYQYKADLLKKHNIAVWRNHDDVHSLKPDGVTKGVLEQLHWQSYADQTIPNILTIPALSLQDIISYVKARLIIEKVRYIGDLTQNCRRVLLMPGAAGGARQIEAIGRVKPDVLICGEIQEWETAEYVR